MTPAISPQLSTLDQLRTFVKTALCEREQLEAAAFDMTERVLLRSGKPCGIFFSVHGPRDVRLLGIWETEHNTVLLYDSTGERFAQIVLTAAPSLE